MSVATVIRKLSARTSFVSLLHSLFKKTPVTPSEITLSPSRRQEFERLKAQLDTRARDSEQRKLWIHQLIDEHGLQYVDDFLEWVNMIRKTSTQLDEVSNERFASCLNAVNWMKRNSDLATINARLWNRCVSANPDLYIGQYKGLPLTVRLNGRVLSPPESDWRQHDVSSVNPPTLLGLRFRPLNEKLRTRVFLFVTLGELI